MLPPPHLYSKINPIVKRMHPIHFVFIGHNKPSCRDEVGNFYHFCAHWPLVWFHSHQPAPASFWRLWLLLNIPFGAARNQWLTDAGVYLAKHWTWLQLSPEFLCGTESVAHCGVGGYCLRLLTGILPSPIPLSYLCFVGALPTKSILHKSHHWLCFWGTHSVCISWFSSLLMDI